MNQDELKLLVGQAASEHILNHLPKRSVLGIGTGSTVNCFIRALARYRQRIHGVVSSSISTTTLLKKEGFNIIDLNEVEYLPIYVDGADEIDSDGYMIKGGGGALTREKIIASAAIQFLCIADESKCVDQLGRFPLPIEVIPLARNVISNRLRQYGGIVSHRKDKDGKAHLTENFNEILDVSGLNFIDPCKIEASINNWPGVVTVGLFAMRKANLGLFASRTHIQSVTFVSK